MIHGAGPIVLVHFAIPSALAKTLVAAGKPVPAPVQARLQVDTGASGTCVKTSVLAPLAITPHNHLSISTPSGSATCPVYDVDIVMAGLGALHNIPVIETSMGGQPIDGLLGRDILQFGMLVYNGKDSSFSLAF